MSLRAKRVVIVGGSSGIGFAVAEQAVADGARVIVASSNAPKVEKAVERLGAGVVGLALDVRDREAVARACEQLGRFDHLVYTAGDWDSFEWVPFAETDLSAAANIFAVRFWGAVCVIRHAHAALPPGGSITLTDGMIAHRPRKGSALGTAMAGAIEHLVRGLAVELAPVRVNAVCPGPIRTGVWDSRLPEAEREEQLQRMTRRQPIARVGEPREVAEAYLYLMRGTYTTGQVLHVDGGGSVV